MTSDAPDLVDETDDTLEDEIDADVDDNPTEDTDEPSPDDVEEATVDLSEDDMGGDLFDGVEGADAPESDESSPDESEDDGASPSTEQPLNDVDASELEKRIVGGAARLGTFGLTEEDLEDSSMTKQELEEEFRATFEAFQLGHYGARFVEEHVLEPANGDVDPTWGLLGTSLMAAATIIYLRPDGEETASNLRDTVGDLTGGIA